MSNRKIYLFGLLTGVLLGLAFPPYPFNFLAFIAFIPLLFALESGIKRKYLLIYLIFFLYHGISNWWISSWQKDSDPFLMISGIAVWLVHPFLFMFPFAVYDLAKRRSNNPNLIYLLPFIWVFFEWLHSFGEIAYPWLTIGYTQTNLTYWVQFADIAGVWGVSFVLVLFNVIFFRLLMSIRDRRADSGQGSFIRYYGLKISMLSLCIALPVIYSFIQINNYNHEDLSKNNDKIKAGIIQPNINPWKKWEISAITQVALHQEIMDSLDEKHPDIDVYIWSETAITLLSLDINSTHNFSFIQNKIDSYNASLLSGFADIYFYKPGEKHGKTSKQHRQFPNRYYDSYNSAILLSPAKNYRNLQIYHKMRLTPFGERIPYLEYYTFALKWLEWGVGISNWALGTEQKVFVLPYKENKTTKLGAVICIESIFPNFVRKYSKYGAEFLTVITNDAWYDYTIGPEQHYSISSMRAIENKKYLARCANTGVSGLISPLGTDIVKAKQYSTLGLAVSIPLIKETTVYSTYGDYLPLICSLVSIFSVFYTLMFRKKTQIS